MTREEDIDVYGYAAPGAYESADNADDVNDVNVVNESAPGPAAPPLGK